MRIFKHYIPLSLLSLGICEIAAAFSSVYICNAFIVSFSHSITENSSVLYPRGLLVALSTVITFYVANLYDLRLFSKKSEIVAKIFPCYLSILVSIIVISSIFYMLRSNFLFYFASNSISIVFISFIRFLYSCIIVNVSMVKEKILILGYNDITEKILIELDASENPTYEVLGCIGNVDVIEETVDSKCPILGGVKDLLHILREKAPDVLVVALSERRGAFPAQEILNCKLQGIRVEDWPTFYEKLTGKILIQTLRPSWLIFVDGFSRNRLTRMVKRTFDTLFAIFVICISTPLMACIAVFTKLDSEGPIIFKQERVGENGKIFTLCKFRTMVTEAEKISGPVWAQTVDPRVTRLGKILRRTGMDELPQLLNVLKGDMSFVGPRPERPYFVSELQQQIPYYAQRLVVKPGITGWAQIRYGYGATIEDTVEKLQYDLYYIKNMSFFLDLLIILGTIQKVLFARVAVQQEDLVSSRKSQWSPSKLEPPRHSVGMHQRVSVGEAVETEM